MASEIAKIVVRDVLTACGLRASSADCDVAVHNVDAELWEVRDVLVGLLTHASTDRDLSTRATILIKRLDHARDNCNY